MEAESTTVPLAKLMDIGAESKAEGKYTLVWDKTGNVATFMGYKASLIDFNKDVVKVGMGGMKPEDALDNLRKSLAKSACKGGICCINLDKTKPDFKGDYKEGPNNWNSNNVFDYAHFHQADNKNLQAI
uniref:hypothetical protein n=1 Tax=Serratia quinivorans TaxID=137545 RepID=UPI0035C68DCE